MRLGTSVPSPQKPPPTHHPHSPLSLSATRPAHTPRVARGDDWCPQRRDIPTHPSRFLWATPFFGGALFLFFCVCLVPMEAGRNHNHRGAPLLSLLLLGNPPPLLSCLSLLLSLSLGVVHMHEIITRIREGFPLLCAWLSCPSAELGGSGVRVRGQGSGVRGGARETRQAGGAARSSERERSEQEAEYLPA